MRPCEGTADQIMRFIGLHTKVTSDTPPSLIKAVVGLTLFQTQKYILTPWQLHSWKLVQLSESYQLILTVSLVPRLPISSLLMAHPINAHHETSMLTMRAKWKQAMAVNGSEALVSAPNLMWVSAW